MCDKCSSYLTSSIKKRRDENINEIGRIRELELELAQTKLAQVEAECKNQVSYNVQ